MEDEYFGPALPPSTTESADLQDNEDLQRKPTDKRKLLKRDHHSLSSSSSTADSSSDSSTDSSDENSRRAQKRRNKREDGPKTYGVLERPPEDVPAANSFIGPIVPVGFLPNREDDDADDWGPKPSGDGDDKTVETTAEEIERRAERMRNKLLNPVEEIVTKPGRETWMMELPPERGKNFGLTARKFSMAIPSGGGDRSGWTETPADRAKRAQEMSAVQPNEEPAEKMTQEQSRAIKRDLEYAQQVEEYNKSKKRSKTLLELHNEKQEKDHKKKHKKEKHKEKKKKRKKEESEKEKKKGKKKEKVPERRPFDRDVDLKVNRLDDAQKQAIIKRSQQLTGRFGHGNSTGKFL